MQYFSVIEPTTKEALASFAGKLGLLEELNLYYTHPQEDYLAVSVELPIFVVADGVTLNYKKLVAEKTNYPNPSPAGDVARIFCEAVVKSASEKYADLKSSDLIEIFKEANREVEKYNQTVGPSEIAGNPSGFYAATGAFIIIKDNRAYWASICDAQVAHFDQEMNKKFISSGNCRPYAVINGEERMAEHIESGVWELEPGDQLFVLSDGFTHYFDRPDFLALFKNWDDELKNRLLAFSAEANLENPDRYGHERSLVAILP